ncbi:hypothetical protein BGX26_005581, partial [Mortierella sp. AD094]
MSRSMKANNASTEVVNHQKSTAPISGIVGPLTFHMNYAQATKGSQEPTKALVLPPPIWTTARVRNESCNMSDTSNPSSGSSSPTSSVSNSSNSSMDSINFAADRLQS